MIILILVLFIAGAALAAYAFIPFEPGEKKAEESIPIMPILQEPLNLRLEEQINSLNTELEQLKRERQNLQTELELANSVVRDLKEELSKFRESGNVEQFKENKEKLELLEKNNRQLSEKIITLEEQIAVYVKDIEKHKAINSDLLNKLKVFEAQIEEYKQEIEKQKAIIQKPAPVEEQVSKKEYDELKKKLEEAEEILRIVHGEGKGEAE